MGAGRDPVAELLRALLETRYGPWPGEIEHLSSVGSTSDHLRRRARDDAPEWTAVLADRQSAGRGRAGRSWASPPGGLYLSVLLRPLFDSTRSALLPLAAGVAACEAIRDLGLGARIKWPNDLMAGDRKLGGILVEATSDGSRLESAIVGVGINLDVDPAALPPELRASSTSMRAECGRAPAALEAAAAVLARLRGWYDALARDRERILAAWREWSAPWWGRPVEVRCGERILRGTARDIDDRGALLLDLPDGSTLALLSGDARELRLTDPG